MGKKRTIFTNFINKSNIKIFEYFLEWRETDVTFNDVLRSAKINRKRGYFELNLMLKNNIVIKTRTIKNFSFYRLNFSDRRVIALCELFDIILKEDLNVK